MTAPTAAAIRHVCEALDQGIVWDQQATIGHLLDWSGTPPALSRALAAGLRAVAGDGWRELRGQAAHEAARALLREAERL